jgi:hypothetical protein
MTDALKVLQDARQRVEKGWVKGTSAVDAIGESVSVYSPDAVCFCASGAIAAGGRWNDDKELADELFTFVVRQIEERRFLRYTKWNDAPGRTQDEVLAAFDQAIELAKQGVTV